MVLMWETIKAYTILVGNLKWKDNLRDADVNGKVKLLL
jgi:hypothetical protein